MTNYKHKFINFLLVLLPFLYFYIALYPKEIVQYIDIIFRCITFVYFTYFAIFKSNSRFRKLFKLIIPLAVFGYIHLILNLHVFRLSYFWDYTIFVLKYLYFPFIIIGMMVVFNDIGMKDKSINKILIFNSIIYSSGIILFKNDLIGRIDLSYIFLLLYLVVLMELKPKAISFIISTLIIYSFSLVGTIHFLIGALLISSLVTIVNIKKKEYKAYFLVTILMLIINFDKTITYDIYKFSVLNFIVLFGTLLSISTTYVYNLKNKKVVFSKEFIIFLTPLLTISYSLLFNFSLSNNFIISFYLGLFICYTCYYSGLFQKEKIVNNKITIISPISFRINNREESLAFAKKISNKFQIEILFANEENVFYDLPKKATVLFLSNKKRDNIKKVIRKYVMYCNSKFLIVLDNESAKILNNYGRTESNIIMIKQGDFTSIAYKKFLNNKLYNISDIFFTSRKAKNIYSSVLENKNCYYISDINNYFEKFIKNENNGKKK